ncbi:peroxidase 5-like [Castanea sativa]|uniref:peroxidase 5-like n=1 Tax=Castanea sativa TaxID=21020 RepID=UPI003F6498B4
MASGCVTIVTIFIFCSMLHASEATIVGGNSLHVGFYDTTCPQVEKIVADVVDNAISEDRGLAAALIRVFFHDCFVNGCDASILLDSTPSGEPVEKESPANGKTIRGLEIIDEIKDQIEEQCPETVSCADILAFATRDAVVHSGLSNYPVPAGRRDGLSSRSADVLGNIFGPKSSIDEITESFIRKGLTVEEMVVLTGAHSIGKSHCKFFQERLYNHSSTNTKDPNLDDAHANYLSRKCPARGSLLAEFLGKIGLGGFFVDDLGNLVDLDHVTPIILDNAFYINLLHRRSLLQSDQAMAFHPRTSEIVQRMAVDQREWSKKFTMAMNQLGRVDVLTGEQGEIRKNCRAVN